MKSRSVITIALTVSLLVGVAMGTLVTQIAAPDDASQNTAAITGVGSGIDGAGETADEAEAIPPSDPVFTVNEGAMQSVRGIKGIDTVTLQNLEAVLRMQTPPLPPTDGGGGRAAALMTMETDQPPDPEEEPDGREELIESDLKGS